jgi:4-hydroxybenzoate polyprenyltransferase
MISGIIAAWASGPSGFNWKGSPLWISILLVMAIFGYDAIFKSSPAGPLIMASCRFLNVLLGLSIGFDQLSVNLDIHLALTIAIYILGITWFARTEEMHSDPKLLRFAAGVIASSWLLALAIPTRVAPDQPSLLFPYLLLLFGGFIARPIYRAISQPSPARVQSAVKSCILGLIAFDAIMATVFVGLWGMLILFWLLPALLLGKWVYST